MAENTWEHPTELVRRAVDRGVLSSDSQAALSSSETSSQIDEALKGSFVDKTGGELVLITMQIDDSGSMEGSPAASVIRGHNEIMDKMSRTPYGQRTLLQTRSLKGLTINPFRPFSHCHKLSANNYQPTLGHTPLFKQTLITLGAVLAKTEELATLGSRVRTGTLIMTDGVATDSNEGSQWKVASLVADMRKVGDHIVAGMGIGESSGYWTSFRQMGIEPELIFSASSRDEILRAFRMFGFALLELTSGRDQAVQTFGQ